MSHLRSNEVASPAESDRLDEAGLARGGPDGLVIRRRRCGTGFIYLDEKGRRIERQAILDRVAALAIPPNYRDVRVARDPRAHLQAIGVDSAGRTQYRYHPRWEAVREGGKIDRLAAISQAIGRIRRRIARDIRRPLGAKEKALAALVMLIDRSHIRVGCENYVHSGRSRGAATLLKRNVEIAGDAIRLKFYGKGRHPFDCSLHAPTLARGLDELCALAGSRLFQYRDPAGRRRPVTAEDVNLYLRQAAGAAVTAKDFRTLAATAEAAVRLAVLEPLVRPGPRRRQVAAVIAVVARLLGNTPAVARKSYVHGELVRAFEDRRLSALFAGARPSAGRRRGEELVALLFGSSGP